MANASTTPFRNVIPVCVMWYMPSIVLVWYGIFNVTISYTHVYGKCQRTIYFILHKRKIKLSFIRNGEQYATSYSTDENEANVEIEYAAAMSSNICFIV